MTKPKDSQYTTAMISCILLTAGLSSRFGSPKALAQINNTTVIKHILHQLLDSLIDEIIIVTGSHADEIKSFILKHEKVQFVHNNDYNLGQTSSFKCGLKNIHPKTNGILLLPIDYPLIKKETINQIITHFLKKPPTILIPTFNEKKGHPPIFHPKLKTEFQNLENTQGLNTIAHHHQKETHFLPVQDCGIIRSFNTKEELRKLMNDVFTPD